MVVQYNENPIRIFPISLRKGYILSMWLQHVITNEIEYRSLIWLQRHQRQLISRKSSMISNRSILKWNNSICSNQHRAIRRKSTEQQCASRSIIDCGIKYPVISSLCSSILLHYQCLNQYQIQSSTKNVSTIYSFKNNNVKQFIRRFSTSLSDNNNNISIVNNLNLLEQIPIEDVRNFCFIAHVDHGKSSLSMRILELTGNLGYDAQQSAFKAAASMEETITGANHEKNASEILQSTVDGNTNVKKVDNVTIIETPRKNNDVDSTGNKSTKERIDMLDSLNVEQQRGITVKASTATMLYKHSSAIGPTGLLLLNMYDTPGHVDFNKEVTRTLQFVQGAVLLLDATQGIQAQTWSVYDKVKLLQKQEQEQENLITQQQQLKSDDNTGTITQQQQYQQAPELLIALTKVDLESARPINVALSVSEFFHWDDPDTIIQTSARSSIGIKKLLDSICQKVPSPKLLLDDTNDVKKSILRAQVVDSWYDTRGVNCLVRIVSGKLSEGDRISIIPPTAQDMNQGIDNTMSMQQQSYPVQEVGILLPKSHRTGTLIRGQMGYVRFGLRDPRQALPGTVVVWHANMNQKMILPQFCSNNLITKSVLYASVHPEDVNEFEDLCNAVDKLALNDTGLEVSKMSVGSTTDDSDGSTKGGPYLGPGIRVGFQGLLHVEVFRQRLHDEYNINALVTPPKVPYTIVMQPSKSNNLKEPITKVIEDLSEWPEPGTKCKIYEPIVQVRILAGVGDAGSIMELINRKRGTELQTKPIDEEKWLYTAKVPWAEVVIDFHDQLKNVTSGFGSLDTSDADPPIAEANLSKVDICLNGEAVESLSFVCHKDSAHGEGKNVCKKLQGVLTRQQFVTIIQAKADGKIIASERIKAYRKDVLTKSGKTVGGGDQTRKMKLLEKQKKGKKKMQGTSTGRVSLSQEAFNSVISRSS